MFINSLKDKQSIFSRIAQYLFMVVTVLFYLGYYFFVSFETGELLTCTILFHVTLASSLFLLLTVKNQKGLQLQTLEHLEKLFLDPYS